jgi:hypothetical protein
MEQRKGDPYPADGAPPSDACPPGIIISVIAEFID